MPGYRSRGPRPETHPNESLANNPFAYTSTRGPGTSPYEKTQGFISMSKEEASVNEALSSALTLSRLRGPQQPALFPPRFGYNRTPFGVADVLQTNRYMGKDADRRWDYSGVQTRYSASTRPSIGHV